MKDGNLTDCGNGVRGRFRYDKEERRLVPCDAPRKLEIHHVQGDEMEPLRSHATPDGKVFTSKSAYRRHLKAAGFRETGGDHLKVDPAKLQREAEEEEERQRREDIEKAYYDVKYGKVEFTEREIEQHKREQREWKEKWKVRSPY